MAAFFLVVPCAILLVSHLVRKQYRSAIQLVGAGALAASFLLVWLIPNYEKMLWFNARNKTQLETTGLVDSLIRNFSGYVQGIPESMSPLLTGLFLVALCWHPVSRIRRLGPLSQSVIGMGFLCLLSCNLPEQRYMIPFFLFAAVFSADLLGSLLANKVALVKIAGGFVAVLIGFQLLVFNFSPYPVRAESLVMASKILGVKSGELFTYYPNEHPTPGGDIWGQQWIIDTIDLHQKGRPGYLFVVPNDPRYNVHTLSLIGLIKRSSITSTTSRVWTLAGDRVEFEPEKLKYYDWFLLCDPGESKQSIGLVNKKVSTGDAQELPRDESSSAALDKIEAAVKSSCRLVGKRRVADGGTIYLYQRI